MLLTLGGWLIVWVLAGPTWAQDHVFLIGGGDQVTNSQAQIESNARWAREVLESLPGQRRLYVYFTDGDDPAPDVAEWRRPPDDSASLQPLARVFNTYWSNGERYRNHRLGPVQGPTDSAFLAVALRERLRGLAPQDRVVVVFNGHGGPAQEGGVQHRILLWSSSYLDVADFEDILAATPPTVPVRFVFTQCYAGGFARLAQPGRNRCGFMAEAADRPAEGCSAAIDQEDFQDYSSYFFAALAGRDRFGTPLNGNPDRDGDGRVTPLEAHYYTLLHARSSDLPRATSEVFLLEWEPWLVKLLLPWVEPAGSPYYRMAVELAGTLGLDPKKPLAVQVRDQRERAEREYLELSRQRDEVLETIDSLRRPLEDEVLRRWPRASYGYTLNFQRFLREDLDAAQAFILAQAAYAELVLSQDRYWELDGLMLGAERRVAGFDRVSHLLELARRDRLLQERGDAEAKARYAWLLGCESDPL